MTPDEIGSLRNGAAFLFIAGQNVFKDKKCMVNAQLYRKKIANKLQEETWYHYKR